MPASAAATMSGQQVTAAGPRAASQRSELFLGALDLKPEQSEQLRGIPMQRLLEAAAVRDPSRVENSSLYFGPVLDSRTLPRHPFYPDAPAQSAKIPMIIGNTRDETRAFMGGDVVPTAMWMPEMLEQIADLMVVGRPGVRLPVAMTSVAYFVPELLLYSRGQERQQAIQLELADTLSVTHAIIDLWQGAPLEATEPAERFHLVAGNYGRRYASYPRLNLGTPQCYAGAMNWQGGSYDEWGWDGTYEHVSRPDGDGRPDDQAGDRHDGGGAGVARGVRQAAGARPGHRGATRAERHPTRAARAAAARCRKPTISTRSSARSKPERTRQLPSISTTRTPILTLSIHVRRWVSISQ